MAFRDLTDKDIERGLWYFKNKKKFEKILKIFLIILIFVLYGFSLFKFINIKIQDSKNKNQTFAAVNFDLNRNKALDLVVLSKAFVANENDSYDVVVTVKNPNLNYVAYNVSYKINYSDKKSDEKQTFILPDETKRLVYSGLKSDSAISDVNLEIIDIAWKKLKSSEMDFPKDVFTIENQQAHFSENEQSSRDWAEFDVTNNSPYNFKNTYFYVLAYVGDDLQAVKQIDINNFYSGDKKHKEVSWFYKIPSYANLIIESDTNVFDKDNYISNK